jgi:hypothetical protein
MSKISTANRCSGITAQPSSPGIVFRAVAECGQSTNVGFVQLLPRCCFPAQLES